MNDGNLSSEGVLQELRNHLPQFKRLYGVTKIGVFGSVARDEPRKSSDIDVVVEMKEPDLFYLVHIKETLEKALKRPVDVIRYRDKMNHYLRARIDKDARYA